MIVFFTGLVVVAVVGFLFRVVANAGIFDEFALRAGGHVEIKLRDDGLGFWGGFEGEDDGEVISFGDRFVRDKFVAVLGEGEFGRGGAVAHDDTGGLCGWGDDFARIV